MPKRRYQLLLAAACLLMTASCAASVPASVRNQPEARPPRLDEPAWALDPCRLARISPDATVADLELAYARRGELLVDCDAARAALQDLIVRERAAVDAWYVGRADRRRPVWKRMLGLR